MRYAEATSLLDIHYVSLLRLVRQGDIRKVRRGELDEDSVRAYREKILPPTGWMTTVDAAEALGISARHVPLLVREKLLFGQVATRTGATFVTAGSVAALATDPELIAGLGIQVPPPKGYVRAAEAMRKLRLSRSQLCYLARAKKIERLIWSSANIFYRVD